MLRTELRWNDGRGLGNSTEQEVKTREDYRLGYPFESSGSLGAQLYDGLRSRTISRNSLAVIQGLEIMSIMKSIAEL